MSDVKFLHYRKLDHNGKPESRGGATVAYMETTDATGAKVIKFSNAYCHEKDNYSKHMGRVKAAGRLKSRNTWGMIHSSPTEFVRNTDGYFNKFEELHRYHPGD